MKIRFRHPPPLLAAAAFPLAQAQRYASDPAASAFRSEGPDAELAKTVADALNNDSSLKGTKISVVVDDTGSIVLVGAAPTVAEIQRASEIAERAGSDSQRVVVNAILPDHAPTIRGAPTRS